MRNVRNITQVWPQDTLIEAAVQLCDGLSTLVRNQEYTPAAPESVADSFSARYFERNRSLRPRDRGDFAFKIGRRGLDRKDEREVSAEPTRLRIMLSSN